MIEALSAAEIEELVFYPRSGRRSLVSRPKVEESRKSITSRVLAS
jgi:hypothetical protein